jgi:endonuclease/exonuclease/phosphatase family metal-dependent hydrolase
MLRAAALAAATFVVGHARTNAAEPTTTTAPAAVARVHRILTCNILFDLPEQKGTPFDWAAGRREACLNLIRDHHPNLVCMQEVGRGQSDDFMQAFPGFGVFGYDDPYVDRRPVRFQNIKNVILYARDRYEIVTGGQYWLTQTPLIAGSHPPGELPRHVTWVRLRDRSTGRQFRVLDTHWALKQPIRLQEAPIIAADTQVYAADFPQLLCGDFNSNSTSDEQRILQDAGWKDTYVAIHAGDGESTSRPAAATKPAATHATTQPAPHHRIDYIYYRGAIRPTAAKIFRSPDHNRPASDHPFVSVDVEI